MAARVRKSIETKIKELESVSHDNLVKRRQQRLLSYGEFEG
jgi:acetyl-CoA carboxylase carboxyl transferase subunit alpha